MKSLALSLALLATLSAFSAGGMRTAAAEECTGPFRECAIGVGAVCSRDRAGKLRMTYWDHPGKVMSFEQCVGRIFEAAGQQNPYKTPARAASEPGRRQAGTARLTVPDSELLDPIVDP